MSWLLHSTAGLTTRIVIGAGIFLVLALIDLLNAGPRATRWREYLFLLACIALAMAYGILNDQITTTISWEYFAYGKGIAENLPLATPDSAAFRIDVAKIGAQATWTAGLLIGAAILIANNPSPRRAQLPYRQLFLGLLPVLTITIVTSAAIGIAGYCGMLARFSQDFAEMLRRDQWRPRRFMAVFGIHLGAYLGGLIGTAISIFLIRRARVVDVDEI